MNQRYQWQFLLLNQFFIPFDVSLNIFHSHRHAQFIMLCFFCAWLRCRILGFSRFYFWHLVFLNLETFWLNGPNSLQMLFENQSTQKKLQWWCEERLLVKYTLWKRNFEIIPEDFIVYNVILGMNRDDRFKILLSCK
jgi:hypothetical protein